MYVPFLFISRFNSRTHYFQVNGAVVSVRPKGDKIGMWLGDSSASESITTVGRRVKERLGIDPQVKLNHSIAF